MANPPPPPPPPQARKKSGLGCLGCGCLILALLALLALGLLGGGAYALYRGAYSLTAPTASEIPTFDGGDGVYSEAQQKINTFNQNVQQNQPASLHLTADEINTLIARNPSLTALKVRLYLGLSDGQAHAQGSLPLDYLPFSLFKGRYFNADTTLSFNFDTDTRTLHLVLHSLQVGEQPLPDENLPMVQLELEQVLNAELQKSAYLKNILDHAKTIEIQGNEFVVETE